MIKLFEIREDGIFPTEFCHTNIYFKGVLEEYGVNAGKVFAYFHYMCSMNTEDNPYYNYPDEERKEIIIRNVCPLIDVDDPLIQECLEQTQKLYETPTYRVHKGFKRALDKLGVALNFVYISLDKLDGNTGELQKASKLYKDLMIDYKSSYKEMQEEMGLTEARGGRDRNKYNSKADELA